MVGARPQFIKAAPVSACIRSRHQKRIHEVLVHTGQHYDPEMSKTFFRELRIPQPKHQLALGGGRHGKMTGRMLEEIEKVLIQEKPDWVLVYGDTNSTLAGALAAAKLHIPVAHVEAGLRSFNPAMPEEINRILTDRISTLLFCPTPTAVGHLKREGITRGVHLVGDVMFDAARVYHRTASRLSLAGKGAGGSGHVFCTVHRQENTDHAGNLRKILLALHRIAKETVVVFAVHPRTKKALRKNPDFKKILESQWSPESCQKNPAKKNPSSNPCGLRVVGPQGYLQTQRWVMGAAAVLTDSGGLQKEAYFHGVPCITLRKETEWKETLRSGINCLAGSNTRKIIKAWRRLASVRKKPKKPNLTASASERILRKILAHS